PTHPAPPSPPPGPRPCPDAIPPPRRAPLARACRAEHRGRADPRARLPVRAVRAAGGRGGATRALPRVRRAHARLVAGGRAVAVEVRVGGLFVLGARAAHHAPRHPPRP